MGCEPDGRWALAASVFTPASGPAVRSAQEAAKQAARYGAFGVRHTRCPPATYSRGRPPGRDWVPPRLLSAYWPRQVLVTALSRPFAHAPVPLASKVGGAAARTGQGRQGEWLSGPTVAAIFGPPDPAQRRKGRD